MTTASEIEGSLVPLSKQQAKILLESATLWMDMGNFDTATEVLKGAVLLMPKSEVPKLILGSMEFAQGHHAKALQQYRAAQKLSPTSSVARAYAAEALLFLGKVKEADKELKAACELEPDGDGARMAKALLEAKEAGLLPPQPKATKQSSSQDS